MKTNTIAIQSLLALVLVAGALAACETPVDCDSDRTLSCPCKADDKGLECNAGLVCDQVSETCRLPLTCTTLSCAPHQVCGALPSGEGACLEDCEPGFVWNADGGKCVQKPATCEEGVPSSIAKECADQGRVCEQPLHDEGAWCGDCLEGLVDAAGTCRDKKTCEDVGDTCLKLNRICVEGAANEDAHCDPSCPPGASPGLDDRCECAAFYAMDTSDPLSYACEPVARCTQDGTCPAGFTCLTCGSTEACKKAKGDQPAQCVSTDCGGGFRWSDVLQECLECPKCSGMGEGATGKTLLTADQKQCLCETKSGYFFTFAGEVGAYPCDKDGDGWVRESARSSMESPDAVLRLQARCKTGAVEFFVLENEGGQRRASDIVPGGLDLYETDRNDDDSLLAQDLVAQGLNKGYGALDYQSWTSAGSPETARVRARQLNPLTRLCHLPTADYNDNGLADVKEWQGQKVDKVPNPDVLIFNRFSYFAELYDADFGVWDGSVFTPTAITNGTLSPLAPPKVYAFRIKERSRGAGSFPLVYGPGAGSEWKTCARRTDASYTKYYSKAGMDFALWPEDWAKGWFGMGHASQFKCVIVQSQAGQTAQNTFPVGYDTARWDIDACKLSDPGGGTGAAGVGLTGCTTQPSVKVGQVRWALAKFRGYADNWESGYERGCVDECAELRRAADQNTKGSSGALGKLPFGAKCSLAAAHGSGVACHAGAFGKVACEETCTDNVDNDGDGAINELPDSLFSQLTPKPAQNTGALVGAKCGTGQAGACSSGKVFCSTATGSAYCKADVGIDGQDYCNGIDDDCDGAVDEDAATFAVPAGGGLLWSGKRAGDDCNAGLQGQCAKAQGGGAWKCDSAKQKMVCLPKVDPPTGELCNGLDDDCDGQTDEAADLKSPDGWKVGDACSGALHPAWDGDVKGECKLAAKQACKGGKWVCAIPSGYVNKTVDPCNGKDDDCDGIIDEWDGDRTGDLGWGAKKGKAGSACECVVYVSGVDFQSWMGSTFDGHTADFPSGGDFPHKSTNHTFETGTGFKFLNNAGTAKKSTDYEAKWEPMRHIIGVKPTVVGTDLQLDTVWQAEEQWNGGDTNFQWASKTVVPLTTDSQMKGAYVKAKNKNFWSNYTVNAETARTCATVQAEAGALGWTASTTAGPTETSYAGNYLLDFTATMPTADEMSYESGKWDKDQYLNKVFDLTSKDSEGVNRGFEFLGSTKPPFDAKPTGRVLPHDPNLSPLGQKSGVGNAMWEPVDCYATTGCSYKYPMKTKVHAIPDDRNFFQRVMIAPGWGEDSWDMKSMLLRLWLRVPVKYNVPQTTYPQ